MKEQKTQLHELSKLLDVHHLEFMVKSLRENKGAVYAQILAYKNARTDMQILDEVVGVGKWQNEYKRDSNGMLQCGIGIYIDELEQWVWKWSNGTPSQFEREKGEYSDAFKRAGYLWGIGRGLYDFPSVWVQLSDSEYYMDGNKHKATGYLKPNNWDWDIWIDLNEGIYEHIVVSDSKGNVRFNMNPHKNKYKDELNKQNR